MGRAKSLGFRAVQLDRPLTMGEVDSLHAAIACLDKAGRLIVAASDAINAAEIEGLEPVPMAQISMSMAEVFAVIEQHRGLVAKFRARAGVRVEEYA